MKPFRLLLLLVFLTLLSAWPMKSSSFTPNI